MQGTTHPSLLIQHTFDSVVCFKSHVSWLGGIVSCPPCSVCFVFLLCFGMIMHVEAAVSLCCVSRRGKGIGKFIIAVKLTGEITENYPHPLFTQRLFSLFNGESERWPCTLPLKLLPFPKMPGGSPKKDLDWHLECPIILAVSWHLPGWLELTYPRAAEVIMSLARPNHSFFGQHSQQQIFPASPLPKD